MLIKQVNSFRLNIIVVLSIVDSNENIHKYIRMYIIYYYVYVHIYIFY